MNADLQQWLMCVCLGFGVVAGCSRLQDTGEEQSSVLEVNSDSLQVYDLVHNTDEPSQLRLSDLVYDDFEIIRLETRDDILLNQLSYSLLTNEFIYVGSVGVSMQPGHLYRFDRNGKFLNEIGRPGRGPGEHVGFLVSSVVFNEHENSLKVSWAGLNDPPQLFRPDGKFIRSINLPYNGLAQVERWSDSLWVGVGDRDWGKAVSAKDSIRLIFFKTNGEVSSKIPRVSYPPVIPEESMVPPAPYNSILFNYNSTWKFFLFGNDTLFRIDNRNPEPEAVFLNDSEKIPSRFRIHIETENYSLISQYKIFPISDPSPTKPPFEIKYYLVDKNSNKARSIRLIDDIFFSLVDESGTIAIPSFIFQENGVITLSISGYRLHNYLRSMPHEKIKPEVLDKLNTLAGLGEDSNDVIFVFRLKEHINFE